MIQKKNLLLVDGSSVDKRSNFLMKSFCYLDGFTLANVRKNRIFIETSMKKRIK